MEKVNYVFQILKDFFSLPENPEFIDYVLLGVLLVCVLLLLFFSIKLLLLIMKGLYSMVDTIGVSLRKECGEITNKQKVKGFEFYSRTGAVTIPDQFILQIEIKNQFVNVSVSEDYFRNTKIKNKVEVSYILGRLSGGVRAKHIKDL